MNLIFRIVADSLNGIASITGFTYNEINIIAYYLVLPFIYVALMDRIFKKHFLKIAYAAIWVALIIFIPDFRVFSDVLFHRSVDFLLLFGHVGLNYVAASVVICVILPGMAFVTLLMFAFPTLRQKLFPENDKQPTA
jgi:hypothetical protein